MKYRSILRDNNLAVIDFILMAFSVVASLLLRLELVQFYLDYIGQAILMILVVWIIKPVVYRKFGMYQRVWAYASTQELKLILYATSVSSVVVTIAMLLLRLIPPLGIIPRSVFIIDWLLSIAFAGGVRFAIRIFVESKNAEEKGLTEGDRQVLIVGAGSAGALVVREMQKNPQVNLVPVAFLDDDPEKLDRQIHGVPVVGSLDDLEREITTRRLYEVIVAIPSAPGNVLRKVADVCREKDMPFRTMPGIYELIGGTVGVNRLREVDIADLLRREPAHIDKQRVGESLSGKRVLVSGAGGSIASELCRQIARWDPSELVLMGHGENSIFEILMELEETYPALPIRAVIADVRDEKRLAKIFETHRPEVVFHAAAHKHVHLMELNVEEAITNNIIGTRNIVDSALDGDVERLVMISTDKAVEPTSVMGATKRMAEMIVLDAANSSGKAYSVVRFGNVLGSRGSVVPLFKRQIAKGGPVTVRHKDIERYFMTIPEAVHLVLQAFALGQNGEMYVLNMGEPVRIMDLAEDMIRLSGLEPGEDIEIVITGMRPGEKLTEDLWDRGAGYEPTSHPDINLLNEEPLLSGKKLAETVADLHRLAIEGDADAVIKILDDLIPGAAIRSAPSADLQSVD